MQKKNSKPVKKVSDNDRRASNLALTDSSSQKSSKKEKKPQKIDLLGSLFAAKQNQKQTAVVAAKVQKSRMSVLAKENASRASRISECLKEHDDDDPENVDYEVSFIKFDKSKLLSQTFFIKSSSFTKFL